VTLFSFAEKTMALMTPNIATSSQNMIPGVRLNPEGRVRDQVLCANSGSFHSTAKNGCSGYENTPENEVGRELCLPRDQYRTPRQEDPKSMDSFLSETYPARTVLQLQ